MTNPFRNAVLTLLLAPVAMLLVVVWILVDLPDIGGRG